MTIFEYACFVSYRNSRKVDGLISSFALELTHALEQYLDAHLVDDISQYDNEHLVFLDRRILDEGDFLPPALGQGLAKSLCWIVVFTPNYLGGALWCASELHTMLELETARFSQLELNHSNKSFVIPLVLRGKDADIPKRLRTLVFSQDFRKFLLSDQNIGSITSWAEKVDELASYIAERQRLIKDNNKKGVDLCADWEQCSLIDVTTPKGIATIKSFIESINSSGSASGELPIS
jgi:TIR domain